jgi:hypothetical protein
MTVRLAISVEGQTEYEFCREVLRPHLAAVGVYIEPKIVVTKRHLSGPNATGGAIGIDRFQFFREHLNQRYDKPFHGPLLAMEIGLPAIRSACPRFHAWMTQLEQLTN